MVITFDNVEFKYIEKKILDKASFSVTDTDKVGIIGVNGTGKTTLLKLILGEEKPKGGTITISGGMVINYLPQDPQFPSDTKLIDIIMADSTKEHPIKDYEAKSILSKMGFDDPEAFANNLSGGEKKRLALCKVLVTYCDMLILDEPTNHLDNDLICWLEKFLIKFKHGLLMVTHDRYFLQRVCTKMLELDFGKIYVYDANYEKFLELKAERLANEERAKQKLKQVLKAETEWMHRGVEARRTKSKSRIERFNELSKIEFNEQKTMEFSSVTTRLGKKLIEMKNGSKAYGDKVLFKNFSFLLNRSDIIGIVGANGAGKTTLFKIIMGEEKLDSGELILGETLRIGYFSQHLELIDPEIRVIDYIKDVASVVETLEGSMNASTLLERFLFSSDEQYSKVKMLSGGEKRRLQLVRVLMQNPNLLILDEPTNDLDLYTLEILEDYLLSFKGPVLVVSHDRYFLDKICNKLFVYENGSIFETMDTFSEYIASVGSLSTHPETEKQEVKPRNQNKMPAALRNELSKLEEEMPKLENKINELKAALKKETTDYQKMIDLQVEIDEKEAKYEETMGRFFELDEVRESYKR